MWETVCHCFPPQQPQMSVGLSAWLVGSSLRTQTEPKLSSVKVYISPANSMFSVHTDSNATWALGDGGSGAIWRGGTCPHFYKWLGWAQEDSVSRRTANKKLTKLYWPFRKRLPKRLVVGLYVERKSGGHNEQHVPPLSNSFRCRWRRG